MTSADAIARVVTAVGSGRYRDEVADDPIMGPLCRRIGQRGAHVTVDATALYQPIIDREKPIWLYEDHPSCEPPWNEAAICYLNGHGNVHVMALRARETDGEEQAWGETPNDIDWSEVRWVLDVPVFVGGRNGVGEPLPTMGPVHLWRLAVYKTGALADFHWVQLRPDVPLKVWDTASLVLLATLNFMNCRNVELVGAARTQRTRRPKGCPEVVVQTLAVRPAGRASSGTRAGEPSGLTPLTSVRGHPAHYGNCCPGVHDPRGLLFGKYEGRFWIAQHARGSLDVGEHQNDYRLVAE